ncbi:MAG: hypothetical protein JKX85_00220 [Phycisphaeraceae bacterium]|nr:hypothetical protein [Phycisphaeraceae bacterium]
MTHTQSVHANQQKPHTESFKETFESVVMAFILAFVFRAFIVEAFVIPTGSMAPTLLGQHMNMTCVECGYRFNTDILKSRNSTGPTGFSIALTCPMCSYPVKVDAQQQRRPGDRILVHKFIYNLTEPKRWTWWFLSFRVSLRIILSNASSVCPMKNYLLSMATSLPNL